MRTPTVRGVLTWLAAPLLAAALAGSMIGAVCIGPAAIDPGEVVASVAAHLGWGESPLGVLRDGIVWELRLPRVLTAATVGAGLAVSGVVMQAMTRNSLADPYLLGLSSGASLGAVSVLLLGLAVLLPVAAFVGALTALTLTLGLAGASGGLSPTRTVLAGVAVSAAGSAMTSFVIFWSAQGDSFRQILNWLLGSLSGSDWGTVAISAGTLLVIGVPVMLSGRALDAFAFGDTAAAALGVHVPATRAVLMVATALLTGAMVAVSGAIGFIGLVLPHAVRLIVGSRHRPLLPLSALLGALVLLWADTAARTVFDPRELPVGIVTALLGAPVFAALLAGRRTR